MRFKDQRALQLKTPDDMLRILEQKGNPATAYKKGTTIRVHNRLQQDYQYTLTAAPGKDFDPDFHPAYTPAQLLALGVFEGKYLNDCLLEYPKEWFLPALRKGKLSPQGPDPTLNAFGVKSRLSLREWQEKGWVSGADRADRAPKRYPILADPEQNPDRRGWFEWYCRYTLGRRLPALDAVQIQRWRAFKRHLAQVQKNCKKGDLECRPVQRQALLQWAYDPFF